MPRTSLRTLVASRLEASLLELSIHCYPSLVGTSTGDAIRFFKSDRVLNWLVNLLHKPRKKDDKLLDTLLYQAMSVFRSTMIVRNLDDLLRFTVGYTGPSAIDMFEENIEDSIERPIDVDLCESDSGVELGGQYGRVLTYPFPISDYYDSLDYFEQYADIRDSRRAYGNGDEEFEEDELGYQLFWTWEEWHTRPLRDLKEEAKDEGLHVKPVISKQAVMEALFEE
jgi:hypothetical protein